MLPAGHRVIVPALGETPLAALDTATLEPQPAPVPGAREVVIAVKSASVGWVDLIMMAGQYQHVPAPPYTPGLEYAGVVAAVGPEAPFAVGDRVLVDPFLAGPRSLGAYRAFGGFASYAVAPAEAVLPLPAALSFDQACNLLGNYETAYHCLFTRGRLQAGESVLILGASGATGLAAVHLAKLLGATVIAAGRNDERLAIVRAQGADHVLNTSNFATLRDDVKRLTGKGVDVVYDGVGGDISAVALRTLRFGGRFLIVGWAATPGAVNQLPTNLIMMKGVDVLGCPTVISTVNDPTLRPPRLAQVLAWAVAGQIKPHVSHVFPLAEFKTAMELKWRGEVVGGCVLHPE
ncbi:MAG: NADPH:quinone oxidoreductase family protein [Myxococcota bacterium]|nr:NADPH:quinone oxidoreductase family protein [Deltaproteobacteria bacterium]MDQ3337258.1 NADPH:quinone oxidoreductase family protein [Myxococcota bacterium]